MLLPTTGPAKRPPIRPAPTAHQTDAPLAAARAEGGATPVRRGRGARSGDSRTPNRSSSAEDPAVNVPRRAACVSVSRSISVIAIRIIGTVIVGRRGDRSADNGPGRYAAP